MHNLRVDSAMSRPLQSAYSDTVSFYTGPGAALDFDGSGDFIDLTAGISDLDFGVKPATIEFWLKSPTDHKSVYYPIVSYGDGTSEFLRP